ncbi:MAG: lasso peptide biosynthesis B2 protein [Clostridia bacterium]
MIYKGFSVPWDSGLFFKSFSGIRKWNKRIRTQGFNNLIGTLQKPLDTRPAAASDLVRLKKMHRVLYFLLVRIMHHENPCTVASIVLFDECRKESIDCVLVVGAEKTTGRISGHSWIEIDGSPINEDIGYLGKFTRMKEV